MTEFDGAPLVAFSVSTAVGSGKTRAAIKYMVSDAHSRQNFIYVAPTVRLIDQTAKNLRDAITEAASERDVSLIHSDSRETDSIPVAKEAVNAINGAGVNSGLVVIITTVTFLRILAEIEAPQDWRVIVDEGFSPVEFIKFHLGTRADDGLDHFLQSFAIDKAPPHAVRPAAGQLGWVEDLASGNLKRAGEQNASTQPLAAAVTSPAIACELIMSQKVAAIMATASTPSKADPLTTNGVAPESILLFACYVKPDLFKAFGEITFMAALFERTMLFLMWTTMFGVVFKEHPAFPTTSLRDIHVDQGLHVSVAHLLHPDDRSSKYNLERNRDTNATGERGPGLRVIDNLVSICADYFKGSDFLLQTNRGYGYTNGSPSMPNNAVVIPASSHGLNEFQGYDNVAALAVTNPVPQEADWIMSKTGLTKDQTNMAFRIHTTYQAVGRSSIRKAEPTSDPKVFLTVGKEDALVLHDLFEDSTWLGQVGGMKSLSIVNLADKVMSIELDMADRIEKYLDGIPETDRKVSSRSIKQALQVQVATSSWTRAVQHVDEFSNSWALEGQSFVRRDAVYYGFVDETDLDVVDEVVVAANVTTLALQP